MTLKHKSLLLTAVFFLLALLLAQLSTKLPTVIVLVSADNASHAYRVYLDTGSGFNEADAVSARSWPYGASMLPATALLPAGPILRLRVDPPRGTVRLRKICIQGLYGRNCWSPREMKELFLPNRDIETFSIADDSLLVTSQGKDPHFIYDGDFSTVYKAITDADTLTRHTTGVLLALPATLCLPILLALLWKTATRASRLRLEATVFQLYGLYLLFGLFLSGVWTHLDAIGPWYTFALFGFVLYLALAPSRPVIAAPGHYVSTVPSRLRQANLKNYLVPVLVTAIGLAPALVFLILTWGQEFPYVGDQHYNLESSLIAHDYLAQRNSGFLLVTLICLLALVTNSLRFWLPALAALTVGWAYLDQPPIADIFARYPAGARIFAAPFLELSLDYNWDSYLNALRVANVASGYVWLLVLRPLFLKRAPDFSALVFCLVFFYNPDVAYYFSSGYLEPWAIVFTLLAFENLLTGKGEYTYLNSCLLIGIAAVIKEPFIFALPWVWLAGRPWRHDLPGLKRALLGGVVSGIPFPTYYLVRTRTPGTRETEFFPISSLFDSTNYTEYHSRLMFHLGTTGIVLAALLLLLALIITFRSTQLRLRVLAVLAVALTLFILFQLDTASSYFTGYPRFYMLILAVLASTVFLVRYFPREQGYRYAPLIIPLLAFGLNAHPLSKYLQLHAMPDPARNFLEHYDAPVYLPVRALVEKAAAAGALEPGYRILIRNNLDWGMPSPHLNYRDLARKYHLVTDPSVSCYCSSEKTAVLIPFIYFTNLSTPYRNVSDFLPDTPNAIVNFTKKWNSENDKRDTCYKQLTQTCQIVFQEEYDGQLIGLIGARYSINLNTEK